MSSTEILRYTAFTTTPDGGNPAGVVLDASALSDDEMLAIAADLGYSETAFLTGADGAFDVRYFSPVAEVPFCGHATIAAGVAAAAAFGAYLRAIGQVTPPARVTIHQGEDMGRPSLLLVDLEAGRDEVQVTGSAVPLPDG